MTNDKEKYDKLNYFFIEKKKVFFRLNSGLWRKGFIIDLNERMKTIVLKEDILGEIPILFEEVIFSSIAFAKEVTK